MNIMNTLLRRQWPFSRKYFPFQTTTFKLTADRRVSFIGLYSPHKFHSNAINASYSSFSSAAQTKYDVFISFRGEDTRQNLISHLYKALLRENVETFIDDVELPRGDEISPSLLKSIESSDISLVVFSQDYASSGWCLEELAKIMECKRTRGQIVLPVFYGVDPSHVRKQSGSYATAFVHHEGKNTAAEKLSRWRSALTEAANLSGFDSRVIRPESKLVDEVVVCILENLRHAGLSDVEDLIGIESHLKAVETLLGNGLEGVLCVGIWGMAGIGKTTVAGAVFNRIGKRFDGSCFLANVREESDRFGLLYLRNELLRQILDREDVKVGTPDIGLRFLRDRLRRRKVLIVLDDVSSMRQLEFLINDLHYFGSGSRIIVTTRDKDVIKNYVDGIYKVEGLAADEALELFSKYALKKRLPPEDYLQISKKGLAYANGNPLALKVLGSSLYRKSIKEWESAFDRLMKFPDMEIQNILKVSFDDLHDEEKDVFLDIACFFRGEDRRSITDILDGCGFSADIAIRALIDKSLITVLQNKLQMHDLIQEMGKEIVRQESPRDPGKRSRLWKHEEIYEVLTRNKGTETVEGMILNLSEAKEMKLSPQAFENMCNLRVIKFYNAKSFDEDCKVHLPDGLEYLSEKLRYLHWHSYPLKSLPDNFSPDHLVELHMNYSRIEWLWIGLKHLGNLRWIDLSHSQNLEKMVDLSEAPHLRHIKLKGCRNIRSLPSIDHKLESIEFLDLSGCRKLNEFPEVSWNVKELLLEETAIEELSPSIENFDQLVRLNMRNCKMLKKVPSIGHKLPILEVLDLSGCSNLTSFPEISWSLKRLLLSETAIEEIPSSIKCLDNLFSLELMNCLRLKNLPSTICELKCLRQLNLSGSSNFSSFPEIPEAMECLKYLDLEGTNIQELPATIENLSGIVFLILKNCKSLVTLPDGIGKLKSLVSLNLSGCSQIERFPKNVKGLMSLMDLKASGCRSQVTEFLSPSLCSLGILHLSDCGLSEFPEVLIHLPSLWELDISRNEFKTLSSAIKQLSELQILDLSYCMNLQSLPELPASVKLLIAHNCTSMETISGIGGSFKLAGFFIPEHSFVFANCSKLDQKARRVLCTCLLLRMVLLSLHLMDILSCRDPLFHQRWMNYKFNEGRQKSGVELISLLYDYKDVLEPLKFSYRAIFDMEPPSDASPFHLLFCVGNAVTRHSSLDPHGTLRLFCKNIRDYLVYHEKPSMSFCFPGTEFPDWFFCKNDGSSITLSPDPAQVPNNPSFWTGFAVCALVEFDGYKDDKGFSIKCEFHFRTKKVGAFKETCYLRGWDGQKGDHKPTEVLTDHVLLGFDSSLVVDAAKGVERLVEFSQGLVEVSLKLYAVDRNDNFLPYCNIKKCGILALYSDTVAEFVEDMVAIDGRAKRWFR